MLRIVAAAYARGMEAALLVLVLAAGDAASQDAAQRIAAELAREPAPLAVLPPPAAARVLAERGLADAELVARGERVRQATLAEPNLAILRVERRESGRDRLLELEVWARGRRVPVVIATGPEGDPLRTAAADAARALQDAAPEPAEEARRREQALIAAYIARADWAGLAQAIAELPEASPHLRFVAVAAALRAGDRSGAERALAALRAAHPEHQLTAAAALALAAEADDGPTLRDPAPEP